MKQIIFFILLLTTIIYSQPIDTTGLGSIALPDSVLFSTDSIAQRAFSDLKYETKSVINVLDYNAVGDASTDNATAIQNAITATPEGGVLFFPEGTYYTSTGFQINKSIRILGKGKESVIRMTAPNSFQVLFYMGGSDPNGTPYPDFATGTSYTFGGILRKGQRILTGLSSTTGLVEGDDIYLALGVDTIDTGQNAFRMFNKVDSVISSSSVLLTIPIPEDVDSTFYPLAWAFAPKTHVLHKYTNMPEGFEIGNLSIEMESGIQNDALVIIYRARNIYVHDLFIDRPQAGTNVYIGESENATVERLYVKEGSGVGAYGSRNVVFRDVFLENVTGNAFYIETQNRQVVADNFTIQYGADYTGTVMLFAGGNSKGVHLKNFSFVSDSVSQAIIHLAGLNENNPNDIITENFSFFGDTGAVKVFPLKQHTGILDYNGNVLSKTKHYRRTIDIASGLNGSVFDLAKGVIKDFKIKLTNRGTSTNGVSIIQVIDTSTSNGNTILDYGNLIDLLPDDGVYGYLTTEVISLIGSSYPLNDSDEMKSVRIWTAGTVPDSCELVVDIEYYYNEDDGVEGITDSELPLKLNETNPEVYGFLKMPADFTINADSSVGLTQLGGEVWMRDSTGKYITFTTDSITYISNPSIVTNGDFANWTSNDPDDWTVSAEDANDYINESSGAVKMVSTDALVQMYQNICTVGEVYQYSITVDSLVSGGLLLEGAIPNTALTTVGTHTGVFTATATNVFLTRYVYPTNIVFDDFTISVLPRYSVIDTLDALIGVPDTTGITTGYVPKKQADGSILWQPDISTSGSGLFNPDGVTIDTTAGGLARFVPAYKTRIDDADITDLIDGELTASKVGGVKDADYGDVTVSSGAWAVEDNSHNHVISNIDALQDSLTAKANTAWFAIAPHLIDDSLTAKMNRAEMSGYSTTSHTHSEFADTVRVAGWSMGMGNSDLDTLTAGSFGGIKIENNYTITEVSAYTNSGTVTFNIEERAEVTPNTSGVDVITSDLVADTDQQETSTFSNAAIDRDDWLILTIVSITGDPTIFSVTVRGVKTN